jgi:effector-binding domain-containing protein
MKIVKRIGMVLGILVILLVIVSACLPGTVVVSRTRVMPISRATAFEKITTLQEWPKWMTWAKLDTAAVYTYSAEPAVGKGAWYTWKGNKDMGEGKMTITEIYGMDSVKMDLVFADYPPNPVVFKLFDKDKGTEVYWAMTMKMPFLMRIMGLFMDGMMAKDFEGGLEGIETLGLKEPAKEQQTADYTVGESPEMMCLSVTDSCSFADIEKKIVAAHMLVKKELQEQKMEAAGNPYVVNIKFDPAAEKYVFAAGFPVSAEVKKTKNAKVMYGKYAPQKCIMYDYYGSPAKIEPAYNSIDQYIADNKMEKAGYSWEVYDETSMMEKDTAKWLTKIYVPVK